MHIILNKQWTELSDYGDAFAKYGLIGVLIRIEDKIQRGISISKKGVTLVSDEGLKDTEDCNNKNILYGREGRLIKTWKDVWSCSEDR